MKRAACVVLLCCCLASSAVADPFADAYRILETLAAADPGKTVYPAETYEKADALREALDALPPGPPSSAWVNARLDALLAEIAEPAQ